MLKTIVEPAEDINPQETSEWLEALDQLIDEEGPGRVSYLLQTLLNRAAQHGATAPLKLNTPYVNTIPVEEEVPYPGDRALERRVKSLVRYNAAAMVTRQNKYDAGIGGHISTYASLATLVEVGFNHFFRGSYDGQPGDFIYFQGHASPGIYARAFLEGRLSVEQLHNFRHELRATSGLSSYPHPWLMPDFWQFPTVSMGLGPINALYHARFMRYLENRGMVPKTDRKIWGFLGDGETDEPESLGALTLGSREKLDNLIFVVNCNLQRLDGPVRGNGSIVQELESLFRGAGWNVIKCLWGDDWDDLLARDHSGLLVKRMQECVDGELQNFKARGGAFIRKEFFGKYPELLKLVEHMTDEQLGRMRRGGHDPKKVYNAYKRALEHKGAPSVVLAMTIKGYGLGDASEGRNVAHNAKKLKEEELKELVRRFECGIPEDTIEHLELYRPPEDSPEIKYIHESRTQLGGYLPTRKSEFELPFVTPSLDSFKDLLGGSGTREISTTQAFVAVLTNLLKIKDIGKYIVPIIPDEARTFGMDSLFRQVGIYASQGQLYKPVDSDVFNYYRESKDGQLFEEGITEAGAMATFTAAGTAYANFGVPMVPFYIYYSMFGFQRVGDMIWAFADSRGKGFLVGGTAGRTTLSGEGLQHQDGHSLVLSSTVPTCASYDPAYAYELAVIIQDGIRRMYIEKEDLFYYLTAGNEAYLQPAMPEGSHDGILKGIYRFRKADGEGKATLHLFGSGAILNEAVKAQKLLEAYGVAADVWSVTSYGELRRDALATERWNLLHPGETPRIPYIQQALGDSEGAIVAASDYMKIVPDQLAPWLGGRLVSLGTDGFGRSDNREFLRRHFEVDAPSIAAAAISRLVRDGKKTVEEARQAFVNLGIDPEKADPARA